MGGKPEWLKNLERTRETKEDEAERQLQEKANRQRVLAIDGPKLWAKIFSRLQDIGNSASSGDMRVTVDSQPAAKHITIQVMHPKIPLKSDGTHVFFDAAKGEIRCEPLLRGQTCKFTFVVEAGKIVIHDPSGESPIHDDEDTNRVEEICRRILEPIFSRYL
jgi:hypothetical protein